MVVILSSLALEFGLHTVPLSSHVGRHQPSKRRSSRLRVMSQWFRLEKGDAGGPQRITL